MRIQVVHRIIEWTYWAKIETDVKTEPELTEITLALGSTLGSLRSSTLNNDEDGPPLDLLENQ